MQQEQSSIVVSEVAFVVTVTAKVCQGSINKVRHELPGRARRIILDALSQTTRSYDDGTIVQFTFRRR